MGNYKVTVWKKANCPAFMDLDVEECDVEGVFGNWRLTRRNGRKESYRKVRIGIRKKSNRQGEVIFNYLDMKYPKACGTVTLSLADLKDLIARYEMEINY